MIQKLKKNRHEFESMGLYMEEVGYRKVKGRSDIVML